MEAAEVMVEPEGQAPSDRANIRHAEGEVRAYLQSLCSSQDRREIPPKLVFGDGRQIELPPAVLQSLQFVLHHMARGDAFGLVPMAKMLTTNQAAEILNVSRPFLVKLLKDGAIPFTKTGTHHRLQMQDVLRYKQYRDRAVLDMLNELAAEAQEAGDYFGDHDPA